MSNIAALIVYLSAFNMPAPVIVEVPAKIVEEPSTGSKWADDLIRSLG